MSHYNLHELALRQAGDLPDSDSVTQYKRIHAVKSSKLSEIIFVDYRKVVL